MSQTVVTLVVVGTTVAILPAFIRVLVVRLRSAQWDTSASFVLLVAWVLNIRPMLGSSLHMALATHDAFNERVLLYDTSLNQLVRYGDRLLLAASVVLVVRGIRLRMSISTPAIIGLFLLLLGCLAGYGTGGGLLGNAQILLMVVLLAAAFLPRGLGACLGAATFGVTLAIASAFVTLTNYSAATQGCTYKCGPLGILFLGATENENALGLALALSIPFVYLASVGRARVPLTAYITLMTIITGSRTSQAAACVIIVVLLIVKPSFDGTRRDRSGRRKLLFFATIGFLVVGIVTPFVSSQAALTQRGYIWSVARRAWEANWWFGNGVYAWRKLADAGQIGTAVTYSAHNEYLDILFVAGVIGLASFFILLRALVKADTDGARVVVLTVLVPVMVVGVAERPWSFTGIDWLTWSLIAVILAAPRTIRNARESEHHTTTREATTREATKSDRPARVSSPR